MLMLKKCAWCQRPIGLKSHFLNFVQWYHMVSHGICWRCKEEQLKQLDKVLKPSFHCQSVSHRLEQKMTS